MERRRSVRRIAGTLFLGAVLSLGASGYPVETQTRQSDSTLPPAPTPTTEQGYTPLTTSLNISIEPSVAPSIEPSIAPSIAPSIEPSIAPTAESTPVPTPKSTPFPASTETAAPILPLPTSQDIYLPPQHHPEQIDPGQNSNSEKAYYKNLYNSNAVRYQNPDLTACVAATTEMMLNFIAYSRTKGSGFDWQPTTSYNTQEAIRTWERAHDTLSKSGHGTDGNGWRNGLNKYGWNNYAHPSEMVYNDESFNSYDAAVKAAIEAIAKYDKPVGILGWAGTHAQIMTGYETTGEDPAISTDFTVGYIYLTDPLAKDGLRNARISYTSFKEGSLTYRFRAYGEKDSPYDDPYTLGKVAAYKEWYKKFVIIAPVK